MPVSFRYLFSAACIGVFVQSCVKDQPQPQLSVRVDPEPSQAVYVVNEGNFTSGNASISLYNKVTNAVEEDYFKAVNKLALGDVAQSLSFINDRFYVVVNNSGKIVVCDKDFKLLTTITGLQSPRYLIQVGSNKAYVSDYKAGCISVVNLSGNSISHQIALPGWTEDMLLHQNKVYVCNVKREFLYVIDALKDKVEDSIWVGKNVSGITIDKNARLWVLSSGDAVSNPARLSVISSSNHEVEKVFEFAPSRQPFKLVINNRKDSLYFIDADIYLMPVTAENLPSVPHIKAEQRNFYGIGIHPRTSEIYLSDALDYVQRSHITVYSASGTKKNEFKAGINANGFYFD